MTLTRTQSLDPAHPVVQQLLLKETPKNKKQLYRNWDPQNPNSKLKFQTDSPKQSHRSSYLLPMRFLYQNLQISTNKRDKLKLLCEELSPDLLILTKNGYNNSKFSLCKIENDVLTNH